MSVEDLKKMFKLLYRGGAKNILLTGGEPLMRDDFDATVKAIKKCGLGIFLDTNGDFFFNHEKIISDNVDVLGLPIDFPKTSYRNSQNFKTIIKILDFYKNSHSPSPKLRILTTVTKENIDKLFDIGKLIKDYPIDLWKLIQFLPLRGNALRNKKKLEISQLEFSQSARSINKAFKKSFKVISIGRGDRDRAYFFIQSNGEVFISVDIDGRCYNQTIGHIFDRGIEEKWHKLALLSKYKKNIEDFEGLLNRNLFTF
jgi:MoaA/NifB/PqqE/SkfB family radical SAM enzyme